MKKENMNLVENFKMFKQPNYCGQNLSLVGMVW